MAGHPHYAAKVAGTEMLLDERHLVPGARRGQIRAELVGLGTGQVNPASSITVIVGHGA